MSFNVQGKNNNSYQTVRYLVTILDDCGIFKNDNKDSRAQERIENLATTNKLLFNSSPGMTWYYTMLRKVYRQGGFKRPFIVQFKLFICSTDYTNLIAEQKEAYTS